MNAISDTLGVLSGTLRHGFKLSDSLRQWAFIGQAMLQGTYRCFASLHLLNERRDFLLVNSS